MNILRYPRIIVVILLMPLVATMIGMWALQDRAEALDEVPAALVNLDEGATIEVDGEEQTVPFGRLLAGALTQPGTADDSEDLETTGFDWQLTDEESAAEGLRDGSYAAVIVIPEDFSEKLTTIGTPEAEQARIEVTTNDASGIINALVGEAVAQAASANIGDEMAQQYLSELYLGFNDISDSFAEAADGAGELAGGQRELTDGIGSTARGAEDLADGADELAGGQRQLAGGITETADGADQLAGGATQLAEGTRGLETGADELGGGLEQSAAGQRELAAGLGPLADGADELAQGNRDLADGLDQLADGADELAGGLGQLDEGISGTDGQPGLVEGVGLLGDGLRGDGTAQNPGLVGGTQQLAESTDDLADGVELALAGDGTAQNPGAIAGTRSLADGLQGLSNAADGEGDLAGSGGDLLAQCAAELGEDSELCQELGAYVEGASQYQGEVTATLEGSDQQPGLITGARRTADGLEVLADGDGTAENPGLVPATRQFADGAQELAEQAPQVIAGVDDLESQVGQLSEATGQLADGADQLAAGTRESADGARDLADGASGLASGVRETRDGVDDLADGTDQLASGARDLSSGAGALGDGADELADGTQGLAGGARELADGTDGLAAGTEELAGGTRELADGAGQLADGSEELADGTSDLADGLQEGADEVPTYDEAERERMSEMAAQPVGSFTERQNEAAGASTAIFPFVAGLALWLGAFAIYIFLPALSQRFLDRAMPMWMVVLRSLAPAVILGAVQSVMVLAVMTAAGVRPTSPIGVAVVAFAGAIAFAAFHQAVLATLGNRMGRIASLVLLVLQMVVLVGVLPLETAPAPLQAISSFMPLTILSEGLVHASLGGSLVSTTETLAELGAGTLLAVAITLIASRGARDESRRDQVAETDAVPA